MRKGAVAINGYFLFEPYTGMGSFTKGHLNALKEYLKERRVEILLPDFYSKEKLPGIITQIEKWGFHHTVLRTPWFLPSFLKRLYYESIALPLFIKNRKDVVSFMSTYAHPMFFLPRVHEMIYLFILHDAIPWTDARYHRKFTRKFYNWLAANVITSPVTRIGSVSETAAREIKGFFHLKKEVPVIMNGIDHLQKEDVLSWEVLVEKFGVKKPYLLYMGGYDKRKNIEALVDAFTTWKKNTDVQLVLTGNALYNSSLYTNIHELTNTHKNIVTTGFISPSELRTFYIETALFVMPSLQEGFNVNIGEALMEGAQVLASDIPVHKELWEKWAYLVDFSDRGKTHELFERIIFDKKKKPAMSEADKENYSWSQRTKKFLEYL